MQIYTHLGWPWQGMDETSPEKSIQIEVNNAYSTLIGFHGSK